MNDVNAFMRIGEPAVSEQGEEMDARPMFLTNWESWKQKSDGNEYYAVVATIFGKEVGPVVDTMNCHHCLSIEDQKKVADLIAAAPDLVNGINALLGLLQLLSHNPNVPESVREMMRNNHRIDEAQAALAKVSP